MAYQALRHIILALALGITVPVVTTACPRALKLLAASSNETPQVGRVLSVRRVLRTPYFVSRYPQIHYYTLYFAVRIGDGTYCGEYETPVLNEIDDLFAAKDQDIEVALKGKSLELRLPKGRRIKAHVVRGKLC